MPRHPNRRDEIAETCRAHGLAFILRGETKNPPTPDTDIYVRGRAVIDAKVSYRLTRNLKVFVELLNVTDEPLREYTGVRSRENDFEIYKWKAKVGVNFNL